MNPLDPLNQVSPYAGENLLFEPKFLNLEYFFYRMYLFFQRVFGGGDGSGGTGSGGNVNGIGPGYDGNVPGFGSGVEGNTGGGFWQRLFGGGGTGGASGSGGIDFGSLGGFLTDLLYFLIIILLTVIVYSIVRIFEIRKKEQEHLDMEIEEYAKKQEEIRQAREDKSATISRNERWVKVVEQVSSENPADWRLAVMDADNMLDNLLENMRFEGDTLGEKLKKADRSKFKNLNEAWEAHNVRNKIAHEGTQFELTQREAQRVVALYEKAFREFGYI